MPSPLNWNALVDPAQVDKLAADSRRHPQLIFKHSTRCSVSDMALRRLREAQSDLSRFADLHYLDLIAYRPTSNAVADRFGVVHESPQVLLIFGGECVLEQSHMGVRADELLDVLRTFKPVQS